MPLMCVEKTYVKLHNRRNFTTVVVNIYLGKNQFKCQIYFKFAV